LKKALPIIVIVAVVIVAGAAWMFLGKGKGGVSVPIPGEIKKEAGQEGEAFVGKIKDVVARGVPVKCTYTQGDFTGTSFVKGKKMYGEVASEGKTGYVIIKDNCMWSWNTGENQGVKMCFEEDFWEMSEEYAQEGEATVPTEAEYRCAPAIFTDSKFNPPANVNFMDMEEMMRGMQE